MVVAGCGLGIKNVSSFILTEFDIENFTIFVSSTDKIVYKNKYCYGFHQEWDHSHL